MFKVNNKNTRTTPLASKEESKKELVINSLCLNDSEKRKLTTVDKK